MTAADALMLVKQLQDQADALLQQLINEAAGCRSYPKMEKIVDDMILNTDKLIEHYKLRDTNDTITS